jgi:hypothetical protein
MNKINPNAFALACGISWVIFDVIFLALMIISPHFTLNLFSRLTLINLTTITTIITWGNIILSIIGGFLAGYITGFIFAFIYNTFNKFDETHPSGNKIIPKNDPSNQAEKIQSQA